MPTSLTPHRISALCVLSLMVTALMTPIASAQEIPISGTIGDASSGASSEASTSSIPTPPPPPPPPSDRSSSSSQGGIVIPPILPPIEDPGPQPPPAASSKAGSKSSTRKKKSSSSSVKSVKPQPPPPASSSSEQAAEAGSVQFILRPHCTNSDQSTCNTYDTITPVQLQTQPYGKGDVIDMDLVALNPDHHAIKRVRAWIVYDPTVLNGKSVSAVKTFAASTPTESQFSPDDGYVKFQADADASVKDDIIPIAEVKFVVDTPDPSGKSIVGFDDQSDDAPHTYAYSNATSTNNLVSPSDLGVVAVLTQESVAGHGAADTQDATMGSTGSGRTTFVLLQPQNVRITTAKDTVYVAWDSLPSPDLVGYNVYYSTVSGRYIQRRTVTPDATGIALQSLPLNAVYFVAVRGINAANEETAFSQEVAVKVGLPSSSTAPFVASAIRPSTSNPLTGTHMAAADAAVPGASGLPTLLSLALVASAVAGTFVAVRRQRGLSYSIHS